MLKTIIVTPFIAHLIITIIYLSWLEFLENFLWARPYLKHTIGIISFNPSNISVRSILLLLLTSLADVETDCGVDYNGQ